MAWQFEIEFVYLYTVRRVIDARLVSYSSSESRMSNYSSGEQRLHGLRTLLEPCTPQNYWDYSFAVLPIYFYGQQQKPCQCILLISCGFCIGRRDKRRQYCIPLDDTSTSSHGTRCRLPPYASGPTLKVSHSKTHIDRRRKNSSACPKIKTVKLVEQAAPDLAMSISTIFLHWLSILSQP